MDWENIEYMMDEFNRKSLEANRATYAKEIQSQLETLNQMIANAEKDLGMVVKIKHDGQKYTTDVFTSQSFLKQHLEKLKGTNAKKNDDLRDSDPK